jgi:hypothetical protein
MNLSIATVVLATIVGTLVSLPVPVSAPPREAQIVRSTTRLADGGCSQQIWPNFSSTCLRYQDGSQPVEKVRPVTGAL